MRPWLEARQALPIGPLFCVIAHAIELAREGVSLNLIQRQLGHRDLGVTSIDLQGIDPGEIIETIHARRPPMIPASAGLELRL